MSVLYFMAQNLSYKMAIVQVREGYMGHAFTLRLTAPSMKGVNPDIKITLMGNSNNGKSTLLGVLTTGKNDDGKGMMSTKVFRHKHELKYGRTSAVSTQLLGFNNEGEVLNHSEHMTRRWEDFVNESSKLITFVDVAGAEKHFKTIIKGVSAYYPDYICIIIDGSKSLSTIDHEHINLAIGR